MERVLVSAEIINLADLILPDKGLLPADQVRRIVVDDALVDTGATTLSMPKSLIDKLGLAPGRTRQARTTAGYKTVQMHGATKLIIQGRECLSDVTELPKECPVLIGQVPLELLDFLIDPVGQRLIGNPAHDGEQMIQLF